MGRITRERTTMQVVVPRKAYDALKEFVRVRSQSEGKSIFISDVVREALALYFDERDEATADLDFEVDRGGYRGKPRKAASRKIRRFGPIEVAALRSRVKEPSST
jgi:hypothetical protein